MQRRRINPPADSARVIHACQIALAHGFEQANGFCAKPHATQGTLITTKTYFRKEMPTSEFCILVVMALNDLRTGKLTYDVEDEVEKLICVRLFDYLRTEIGGMFWQRAMLLAAYIDHNDIDMKMSAGINDNSGIVIFDFCSMAQFSGAFIALNLLEGEEDERKAKVVRNLFLPDIATIKPKMFSIAPEFEKDIHVFDRKPAAETILKAQLAAESQALIAKQPK